MPAGTVNKSEPYRALVAKRKACRLCPELANPAVLRKGALDSDEIGPYANWQGNLDAPLLVVGQDFADQKSFGKLQGWPGPKVATNLALVKLADAAGFQLRAPVVGESDDVLFFTNAVLCLKRGAMGSRVPSRCFQRCGSEFLRATVELVNPRAVITLGVGALRALEQAFSLPQQGDLAALVERTPAFSLRSGIAVFPRYHPSRSVLNITRSSDKQLADWRRIGCWLRGGDDAGASCRATTATP